MAKCPQCDGSLFRDSMYGDPGRLTCEECGWYEGWRVDAAIDAERDEENMNRLQKRSAFLPAYGDGPFGGRVTVLDCCLALHAGFTGQADSLVDEASLIGFLKCCLETWEPGLERTAGFDNAVKDLIKAALAEAESRLPSNA